WLFIVLQGCANQPNFDLSKIHTPIIFRGDAVTAYRDPAVLFHENTFYLFFTLVEIEQDGKVFSYTAYSSSNDLLDWSKPHKITPRDQHLNFSSPGNIINYQGEWILSLQTYPRPAHYITETKRYGNLDALIFIMTSK
ncbi:unnamed protein product, partial [Chrysoparadoxa australica]